MVTPAGCRTPAPEVQADPPGSLMGEVARLRLERGALQQALTALQAKCEALLAAMGSGTSCQALAQECEAGQEDITEGHDTQVSCVYGQSAMKPEWGKGPSCQVLAEHCDGGQQESQSLLMYMVSRADWQNAMKGAEVRFNRSQGASDCLRRWQLGGEQHDLRRHC